MRLFCITIFLNHLVAPNSFKALALLASMWNNGNNLKTIIDMY
jgi:hypothetical protein